VAELDYMQKMLEDNQIWFRALLLFLIGMMALAALVSGVTLIMSLQACELTAEEAAVHTPPDVTTYYVALALVGAVSFLPGLYAFVRCCACWESNRDNRQMRHRRGSSRIFPVQDLPLGTDLDPRAHGGQWKDPGFGNAEFGRTLDF
jgi:hypothetical protein